MMKNKYLGIVYVLLLVFSMNIVVAQDTNVNFVSSIDIDTGTLILGGIDSTKVFGGDYLSIEEVSNDEALLFYLNVTDIKGNLSSLTINARYEGGASHVVEFSVLNGTSWVVLETYGNSPNFVLNEYDLSTIEYSNDLMFKFNHSDGGVLGHHMDIDYFVVESLGVDDVVISEGFVFFDVDLSDTFTIILLTLFILSGVVISLRYSMFVGGIILTLSGLFVMFTPNYLILGLILLLFGFLAVFNE